MKKEARITTIEGKTYNLKEHSYLNKQDAIYIFDGLTEGQNELYTELSFENPFAVPADQIAEYRISEMDQTLTLSNGSGLAIGLMFVFGYLIFKSYGLELELF